MRYIFRTIRLKIACNEQIKQFLGSRGFLLWEVVVVCTKSRPTSNSTAEMASLNSQDKWVSGITSVSKTAVQMIIYGQVSYAMRILMK